MRKGHYDGTMLSMSEKEQDGQSRVAGAEGIRNGGAGGKRDGAGEIWGAIQAGPHGSLLGFWLLF